MLKTLKQCSNLIKILIDERELTLLNLKRLTDGNVTISLTNEFVGENKDN